MISKDTVQGNSNEAVSANSQGHFVLPGLGRVYKLQGTLLVFLI